MNSLKKIIDLLVNASTWGIGLAVAAFFLITVLLMSIDVASLFYALFSGEEFIDKSAAWVVFLIEVYVVWAIIWKIKPREELAGKILWLGVFILVVGVGDGGLSWLQANSMKFVGFTMAATGHYFVYHGAYNKGRKDEGESYR